MQKIIIDIGSGNIKGYLVNEERKVENIFLKNIYFKKDFSKEKGISENDKKLLFESIVEIKRKYPNIPLYAYATSVFRLLNDDNLIELQNEMSNRTGVNLNVISQQQEEEYMASAVGNIPEFDTPYLVCCVGGSSTEMIVMKNGKIIEQLTEEFATGDMLKRFPQIAEDRPNVNKDDMLKYIEDNFKNIPKTKCKYAIFTGFHLTYNTVAENKMNENTFFERNDIPYYLTAEQFCKNNEEAIYTRSLESLKKRYPQNPNFMNGTRGANTIIELLLNKLGVEYYFPTDLNMINGIIKQLEEIESLY